jgi:hypothetical protein
MKTHRGIPGSGGCLSSVVFAAILLVMASLLVFPAHAKAQGMCGKRADFVRALAAKYQEARRHQGVAATTNLIEVFASKTGTWTILITDSNGKTCILAAGTSWEDLPPENTGKPA